MKYPRGTLLFTLEHLKMETKNSQRISNEFFVKNAKAKLIFMTPKNSGWNVILWFYDNDTMLCYQCIENESADNVVSTWVVLQSQKSIQNAYWKILRYQTFWCQWLTLIL